VIFVHSHCSTGGVTGHSCFSGIQGRSSRIRRKSWKCHCGFGVVRAEVLLVFTRHVRILDDGSGVLITSLMMSVDLYL